MEIRIEQGVFSDAVQWVARSLPTRPSYPILAGMLIKTADETVTLSAFDYETSARIAVDAEITEPGVALVSGKLLADITRALPRQTVTITTHDQTLELTCGSANFSLQLLPADDYPDLPEMPQVAGTVASEAFAQAVGQVAVAAGHDELLPVFTGIRVELSGENIALLATDRYRMALKEFTWEPSQRDTETAALVPAKVLTETSKSMVAGENVTISLADSANGEGLIGFEGAGVGGRRQITTRLLDGELPQMRPLMQVPNDLVVRISRDELSAATRRVALVAEKNTSLRMRIGDNDIVLEAATGDQAHGSETVTAIIEHNTPDSVVIDQAGFNPGYLLDALGAIDAPYVHLAFTGPGKPCLLRALSDLGDDPSDSYRHVIMLMRLSN
ncbi:MAG: DNA polymerase III subunit beta [Propionibacteriaceae bacterium]|jgi:DNA polymerase-3 subunit beta|nr:DNA polymerase III subunit beta [Propionibacteriaceae bacterium]